MDMTSLKSKCSIRGRVAFVLAIAEQFVDSLKYSEIAHDLAKKALDDCWRWEQGETVSGDRLDYYLENAEEVSLAVYESMAPESIQADFVVITSAVAYVAWHAYKKDGIGRMSDSIHQVSESVIDQIVAYAMKSPRFDAAFLECIFNFVIQQSASAGPDGMGSAIPRESILGACSR